LARLYRRIRPWRIAEGTTEILRLTVARRLLAPEGEPSTSRTRAAAANTSLERPTGGPTGHASEYAPRAAPCRAAEPGHPHPLRVARDHRAGRALRHVRLRRVRR